MKHKGDSWNESKTHKDPITGRTVRRITTQGELNQKPPYHTRTTFSEDGEYTVIATYRDGHSSFCRVHVPTGELMMLTDPVKSDTLRLSPGTIAPKSGWMIDWHGKSLKAVNIYTLEERVLIKDIGREWRGALISVDPAEEMVLTPLLPEHPDAMAGKPESEHRRYYDFFPDGKGMVTRLIQVPLAGGKVTEVLRDEGVRICHLEHSPVDGDLVYIDRDLPPMWHAGGDYSKTARCWMLRLSTGKLTPMTPRGQAKFQIHAAWSWDGQFLLYHGPDVLIEGPCPWYIGAIRPDGEIFREWTFENGKHYGHVAAAGGGRPAIVIDGNVTPDQLQWLYYDEAEPRFEVICEHKTEWKSLPGQITHPHPSTDRDGRFVAFNVARGGRADVWVVET